MAEIYGVHFEYGGVSSRLYRLITANVETKRNINAAGTIKEQSIYNKKNQRRYLVDDDYTDSPLSFELDIVRSDERGIEFNERRKIEKWLFNRHDYKRFYIDMEDDTYGETTELINGVQKRLYLNCRFVNPERLEYNGGIVGYRVTLEADSGMWWQDEVNETFEVNTTDENDTETITIETDTDLDDYVYPTIKIYAGLANSTVTIVNLTDDEQRETSVQLFAGGTVEIDSEINYVTGGQYTAMPKRNFPRLLDGENVLSVSGCVDKIEVTYQNRRML